MFDPLKYEAGELKKIVDSGLCTADELVAILQKGFRAGWSNNIGPHLSIVDNMVFRLSDPAIEKHVRDQINS